MMNKIVFLDRDGVINRYPGDGDYVKSIEEFHLLPGVIESLQRLTQAGCVLFILSNQACVGRGIITQQDLDMIHQHMMNQFDQAGGIVIREAFYATAAPDEGSLYRKPQIGYIQKAFDLLGRSMNEMSDVFFVGDSQKDVVCARNAGCCALTVLSGGFNIDEIQKWSTQPDYIVQDILEATEIILG